MVLLINATDNESGISSINITMSNVNSSQDVLVSGELASWENPNGEFLYSKTVLYTNFPETGEWYISSIDIKDVAGNSYTETDTPDTQNLALNLE